MFTPCNAPVLVVFYPSVPQDNMPAGSYAVSCETMDIIFERAMSATAAIINRERAMKVIAGAVVIIERVECVLNTIAAVVFRERVMKAITVTIALLAIAIALPSTF